MGQVWESYQSWSYMMTIYLIFMNCCFLTHQQQFNQSEIQKLFLEYVRKDVDFQPLLGTRLGDHRHSDKLESLSENSLASLNKFHEETLIILENLWKSREKYSIGDRVDLETWINHERRLRWINEIIQPIYTDPRIYSEYISDSTFLLISQTTLPPPVIYSSAIRRIREIPRIVREAKVNLFTQRKPRPAKVFVETAIRQNLGSLAWYRQGVIDQLGKSGPYDELVEACKEAVKSLEDYQKFLSNELLPLANGDWRLGVDRYDQKLVLELESSFSREQVALQANREFSRVVSEMEILAKQLWAKLYPDRPVIPHHMSSNEIIQQVISVLSKDKVPVRELVEEAKRSSVDLKLFIRNRKILDLPDPDRCDIVEMPEFQRGNSVAYLNNAPPLDQNARSIYAISPPPNDWDARRVDTFLKEYNRRMMRILTLHEAYPGHYVQLEFANRNPSVIRKILASGVYIEGWAVHMEQVLLDEGFAGNDLGLKLLQLKWYLRAIGNALLDQGMHCHGWSDEKALQFLVDECFQSEAEAIGKITRSKQSSCQLSTYFVGRMAFQELRLNTQKRLGNSFDLKRYHHSVLELGSVPVKHLSDLLIEKLPLQN